MEQECPWKRKQGDRGVCEGKLHALWELPREAAVDQPGQGQTEAAVAASATACVNMVHFLKTLQCEHLPLLLLVST